MDSADEDSGEDSAHKLDTSKLPWEIEEVVSPAQLRPELRQTRDLLKLYMEDIKAVKVSSLNGTTSSEDAQLTSTKSSQECTLSGQMLNEPNTWVPLNSSLVKLSQSKESPPSVNGKCHGLEQAVRLPMLSLTEKKNWPNMENTSQGCSEPSAVNFTDASFCTTNQYEPEQPVGTTSYCQTLDGLKIFEPCTSVLSEPDWVSTSGENSSPLRIGDQSSNQTSLADVSISNNVHAPLSHANTFTSVVSVDNQDMSMASVRKRHAQSELGHAMKRPQWARDFLWETHEIGDSPSALATETAPPLPRPPDNEFNNFIALKTIAENSHLFKIITPIDVDLFELYLQNHPNRPLVDSVCRGFREGFWPWADTDREGYPVTWDNSSHPIHDSAHAQFLREQRDTEISLGQYSPTFGKDLLPGM
jgi:hypothetical protein